MIDREEINRKSFFRGKSVIKWYQLQYDDSKAESEKESEEDSVSSASGEVTNEGADAALDDEVARIMANFRDAHQSSVDKLFSDND